VLVNRKLKKKSDVNLIAVSLLNAGLMLAGNGNANSSGNAGRSVPEDCKEVAQNLNAKQTYRTEEIAEAFGLQVGQITKFMNDGILKMIRVRSHDIVFLLPDAWMFAILLKVISFKSQLNNN